MRKFLAFLLAMALSLTLKTARAEWPDWEKEFPAEVREWFRNPDGSCVQCSIGMCGVYHNVPEAATLLWDTEYGPRVRGGSYPSRVAAYCDSRRIRAFNVTGRPTWEYMRWAAKTGRMAAIGFEIIHFQTLVWYDPRAERWLVCDNNSPQRIDSYTEAEFRRRHLASGEWVVILDAPPPPASPIYKLYR